MLCLSSFCPDWEVSSQSEQGKSTGAGIDCLQALKIDDLHIILMDITSEMWGWCMESKIYISPEPLPGKLNTVADWDSRARPDSSKWKRNP